MAKKTSFFLGANSASGFYSLYDQLGDPEKTFDFVVLKGGPGVGKSTLMREIGRRAEQRGFPVEYIHCSGDPNSLDAVLIEPLQTVIADGTAPHVIEPAYPAAVDRYVNLGCFYDVERLKERRREVIACTKGYQKEYARAYTCLRACRAVLAEAEESVMPLLDEGKLRRRLKNIWIRERGKRKKEAGSEQLRFLGGLTPAGRCWCTETLAALCPRIYELRDRYHLAAPVLMELKEQIRADGYHVLLCLDPDCPDRIEHVLIPELGLGFVTTGRTFSLDGEPRRCLHLERMLDQEQYRLLRGRLRLKERLAEALEEEGAEHLRLAGEKHEELELIYRPFVDFAGVAALVEEESGRIFARGPR